MKKTQAMNAEKGKQICHLITCGRRAYWANQGNVTRILEYLTALSLIGDKFIMTSMNLGQIKDIRLTSVLGKIKML